MLKIQFIFSKNIVAYEYNFIIISYGPIQYQWNGSSFVDEVTFLWGFNTMKPNSLS